MAKKIMGHSFKEDKMVPLTDAVISKHTSGNRTLYHVKGKYKGGVVCTALSEDDAKEHIKNKTAKKGTGW